MKSIQISIFLILCGFGNLLQAQEIVLTANNTVNAPVVVWENNNVDLGMVKQNEKVTVEFKFSNVGNAPLIISSVKPSCGCTIANYSKESVQPGESSKITAVYNASSAGHFSKSIAVKTNTIDNTMILKLSGTVEL
jgi:hypothetical protein